MRIVALLDERLAAGLASNVKSSEWSRAHGCCVVDVGFYSTVRPDEEFALLEGGMILFMKIVCLTGTKYSMEYQVTSLFGCPN